MRLGYNLETKPHETHKINNIENRYILKNNRKHKLIRITMESMYEAMEFFRFGPNAYKHGKAVLALFVIASLLLPSHVEAMPAPRKFHPYIFILYYKLDNLIIRRFLLYKKSKP